jgi:hypothetical protein
VTDLNTSVETLAFRINGHTYPAHSLCLASGKKQPVTREDFSQIVASVKGQCRDAALMLRNELDFRFPDSELMNSLAIVFPQFWLQSNVDDLFPVHMKTLREHYCVPRTVNFGTRAEPRYTEIDFLLDARTLGFQTSLFKLTMKSNAKRVMEEPRDVNPLTKLWVKVGQNALMLTA